MPSLAGGTAIAFLCAGLGWAQLPVQGRIVDDIDGQPVANARVGLLNENFEVPPIVRTDSSGRFIFSVPTGTYKLAVEKAGFIPPPNDVIDVRDGSPGELSLILTRSRAISARIVWPDGEPAQALAFLRSLTGRSPGGEGWRPDAEGRIFVAGLPPGRYTLTIDPQLGGGSAGRSGITTQFPSPETVDAGNAIDLRYAAVQNLGDIVLVEAAGVEISGKVQITDKISLTGSPSIDLMTVSGRSVSRASGQRDGTFRFPKVSPGMYYLVGNTQVPNYVTFGVQAVQVGATPMRDLVLALSDSPPAVTGQIDAETPQGMKGVGRVSVGIRIERPATTTAPRPSDGEGRFSLFIPTGLGAIGPFQLNLPNGLPSDAYIASVRQGNAVYTHDPFPLAVSAEPVHVLLKRDGATIRGKVAVQGNPPRPAYVVLAPKERGATLYYRTTATSAAGDFQLQAIAPGTYDLFAFHREANYTGEPTIRAYQDTATPVTVAAGQNLTFNLNVVRIEK